MMRLSPIVQVSRRIDRDLVVAAAEHIPFAVDPEGQPVVPGLVVHDGLPPLTDLSDIRHELGARTTALARLGDINEESIPVTLQASNPLRRALARVILSRPSRIKVTAQVPSDLLEQ